MKEKDIFNTAETYLDEQFPKGKTEFRGQAMALLALAKIESKQEAFREVIEFLSQRGFRESNYEIKELTKWLKEKVK
jgi:hypothetical protein